MPIADGDLHAGQYGPDTITSVTGAPARSTPFTVRTTGGDLATLWTSPDKDEQAANPGVTDRFGNVVFYTDPGSYVLHVGATDLPVVVPMNVTDQLGVASITVAVVQALETIGSLQVAPDYVAADPVAEEDDGGPLLRVPAKILQSDIPLVDGVTRIGFHGPGENAWARVDLTLVGTGPGRGVEWIGPAVNHGGQPTAEPGKNQVFTALLKGLAGDGVNPATIDLSAGPAV